jgi:hypothetical protein
MQRAQSFVNAVLLNRQTGESEMFSGSANTRGSSIVPIESAFRPGERVRNTKTGETGVVVDIGAASNETTPVIFDKEFDEWGAIWDVPNYRLELVP